MKLGLLTDIHEHIEYLSRALERFQAERVDRVVVLGDIFETGTRIRETCQLLAAAHAVGVWGNHDFGLCVEPDARTCARYGAAVIDFMTSLQPHLCLDGCHFSHVEPWLDPEQVEDLWYFDGPPDVHGQLDRIFRAVPNRLMFAGHFHKWLLVTPHGIADWHGEAPVSLSTGRYFVVIGALCDGGCAVLDTGSSTLVPFHLVRSGPAA